MSRRCGQVRRSRRCGRFGVPEPSGRLHLDTAIRVSNSLVDFIFSHPSLAVSKEKGIWQNAASGPLAKEKKPLFFTGSFDRRHSCPRRRLRCVGL